MYSNFTSNLKTTKQYKIAVAGPDYVSLVVGVCFVEVGHQMACFDIDEDKVNLMKKGISPMQQIN